MHRRTAPRLARILACAAVPMVLVAGCSDSGGDKKSESTPSATATPSATPTLAAAKYPKLPDTCKALPAKTVEDLVPKVKDKAGKALTGSCFWWGLDDEKADDIQYRALNLQYNGLSSEPALGSADKRAQEFAQQQVKKAMAEDAPKDVKNQAASGIGDWASTVTTTNTDKKGVEYHNATVVARTANVVITLKYSGAGLEGAKAPDTSDLVKDAQGAAKEAVAAVAAANKR
ncbi:hypothetical protein I5Q34_12145 [Streptomyces sp. AV19]|uniref:hypothetical protein n=1 Tax=Streptomyces sp. AV19 TaxID=2793068 RepID=UPI0018FEF091|nr:hypothetical protein [Streptomyces sp. AV19]MBH1935018.1 hypothetical protein [Streptomyces sp. AV19]MDG4530951.1 DUF3558 domain-containing protein [Streptomyces sp. AV19]